MCFESSRLQLARARRGLTKKALAEKSGISVRTISTLESDRNDEPAQATIVAISEALSMPPEFFSRDPSEMPLPDAVSFRAMKSLTARERDSALASAAIALELSDLIALRFQLPDVSVPTLPDLSAEQAAEAVRSEWGMGSKPVGNVVHHLEAHGIRVFSLAQESASVDAFSLWREGRPFVFLNTFKTAERSRMDAAHELAHLVLHEEYDRSVSRDLEREATAFASAFLMPATALVGRHSRFPGVPELIEAKKPWAVSLVSYVYRLHVLEQISDWHFRSLFKTMSRLGYRTSEPEGTTRETSAVLSKVLKHLRSQGIGIRELAQELQVNRRDVEAVLLGLVVTSVPTGGASSPGELSMPPTLRVVDSP